MKNFTAYIEKDLESGMYVGVIPSVCGAHTMAETIDELQKKLTEVLELCLEEMGSEEVSALPIFSGTMQIEVAI